MRLSDEYQERMKSEITKLIRDEINLRKRILEVLYRLRAYPGTYGATEEVLFLGLFGEDFLKFEVVKRGSMYDEAEIHSMVKELSQEILRPTLRYMHTSRLIDYEDRAGGRTVKLEMEGMHQVESWLTERLESSSTSQGTTGPSPDTQEQPQEGIPVQHQSQE